MAGRRPKPTHLKLLAGNPGKRPLPKGEPKYARVVSPSPPAWLPAGAKEEWKSLAPELVRVGTLTKASLRMFASLCYWADQERELVALVEREGRLYTKPSGVLAQHPACVALRAASRALQGLCVEFGLSPASSPRVKVPVHEEETDSRW